MICEGCGVEFESKQRGGKYPRRFHSEACRRAFRYLEVYGPNGRLRIPSASIGTIGELAVAIDLLQRGYGVYRAISPACRCDLVAVRNDRTLEIEVRTGYVSSGGKVVYGTNRLRGTHVAVYVPYPTRVIYIPELEQT